jgi:CRISPR-associated protein Cas1
VFDGPNIPKLVDWASRNEHWISESRNNSRKPRRRHRQTEPLVLCGHGISLRIDAGTLLVRNGLTHYPQQREKYRFFKGDPAIPPRIILLDGSGCISLDVLDWLAEQRVSLVRMNWQGNVASVLTGTGFAADPAKVRWQAETRADPDQRMAFAIGLIRQKIANSIATLGSVVPASQAQERAIARHRRHLDALSTTKPASIDQLLGIEGPASGAYFKAWEGLPLHWTGTSRRPIPDDWRVIGTRSSMRISKAENVGATHPMNAMLNYAYAVQQTRLRIQTVADGYDPTAGILHSGRRGEPGLVFDLMEPNRPRVDAALLTFALSETFNPVDFVLRSDGVVKLTPQLARRVCQLADQVTPAGVIPLGFECSAM